MPSAGLSPATRLYEVARFNSPRKPSPLSRPPISDSTPASPSLPEFIALDPVSDYHADESSHDEAEISEFADFSSIFSFLAAEKARYAASTVDVTASGSPAKVRVIKASRLRRKARRERERLLAQADDGGIDGEPIMSTPAKGRGDFTPSSADSDMDISMASSPSLRFTPSPSRSRQSAVDAVSSEDEAVDMSLETSMDQSMADMSLETTFDRSLLELDEEPATPTKATSILTASSTPPELLTASPSVSSSKASPLPAPISINAIPFTASAIPAHISKRSVLADTSISSNDTSSSSSQLASPAFRNGHADSYAPRKAQHLFATPADRARSLIDKLSRKFADETDVFGPKASKSALIPYSSRVETTEENAVFLFVDHSNLIYGFLA